MHLFCDFRRADLPSPPRNKAMFFFSSKAPNGRFRSRSESAPATAFQSEIDLEGSPLHRQHCNAITCCLGSSLKQQQSVQTSSSHQFAKCVIASTTTPWHVSHSSEDGPKEREVEPISFMNSEPALMIQTPNPSNLHSEISPRDQSNSSLSNRQPDLIEAMSNSLCLDQAKTPPEQNLSCVETIARPDLICGLKLAFQRSSDAPLSTSQAHDDFTSAILDAKTHDEILKSSNILKRTLQQDGLKEACKLNGEFLNTLQFRENICVAMNSTNLSPY